MDAVEHYVQQWQREKPDLDVSPMAVVGRMSRLAAILQTRIDAVFAEFGLQSWEFDVLATLKRSGPPYTLTPGELDRTMMISSGTTTHRVTKVEQRGWVTRRRDPDDRRVVRVSLTEEGAKVFDAAHEAHIENERQLLAGLNEDDRQQLLTGLIALANVLGDHAPPEATTRVAR